MIIPLTTHSSSVWPKKRIWELLLITHSHGKSMLFLSPQKLTNCSDFWSVLARCWRSCQSGELYNLSLVKSQLCFGTQVWSPSQHYLKAKIERVQRRATRWILRTRVGELSYRERLERLNLLPLVLDRELKDLVFFYKCLHGYTDLNIHNFVSFVTHGRTRQSNSFNLKYPLCITSTFQASYFNRIVRLWNTICNSAPKTIFSSLNTFQNYVKETLFDSLKTFDVEWPCTWSSVRLCACHRP